MWVRTEVIIETHQVVSIRGRALRVPIWCAGCAGLSEMATPDEAAVLRQVDSKTIARWLEATLMHRGETSDGQLVVCLASLFQIPDMEARDLGQD